MSSRANSLTVWEAFADVRTVDGVTLRDKRYRCHFRKTLILRKKDRCFRFGAAIATERRRDRFSSCVAEGKSRMTVMNVSAAAVGRTGIGLANEGLLGLDYGVACSTDVLEQAFQLVHDQYVARGYMRPERSSWRLSVHHAVPTTKVFVAQDEGRVVGTMTLIPDSPLGLPLDALYDGELATLRNEGRYVAEVSGLAIAEDVRASGLAILTALARLLGLYAIEVAGCHDICIAVNPRHVGFYRRLFPHAVEIGERRSYAKVNGAPAVAVRIDLESLAALFPSVQGGTLDVSEAYRFFMRADDFDEIVARLEYDASKARLTPRQFRHFFSAHPALAEASADVRASLQKLYPSVDVPSVVKHYRSRAALFGPQLGLALLPA